MITQKEYELLKHYRATGYRWIARDKNKGLYVYTTEPEKRGCEWRTNKFNSSGVYNDDGYHLFQYIKWEDEEPTRIDDLIRDYESHQIITGGNNVNKAELVKEVEKEKLYTVRLANGDCLYKFETVDIDWIKRYSDYKNDPDFHLTQAEIESVDPVLMQIAKEVE